MADYPEWVLKHKKKGTYINFQNGKYYLYAAHSERVPGTDKVVRVSDGYIGRITEKDGLIPAKGKLSGDLRVYEYGLSSTTLELMDKVHMGLRREFRGNADRVLVMGILSAMHGTARPELYETSWLSVRFPDIDFEKTPTDRQKTGIERTARMAHEILWRHFGEEYETALLLLPSIHMAALGKERRLCRIPEGVQSFAEKYSLDFQGEV
jgi:hypothetical protein